MAAPPTPPGQETPQTKIALRKDLVLVPVTVKDAAGHIVLGIRQDEFRIFEDGVEQTIEVFSDEAFPVSAVVLIDNDLPRKAVRQVNATLAAIAGGFSAEDEASLCTFDQMFHEGPGFTTGDKLLAELEQLRLDHPTAPPPSGGPFSLGPRINGQSPSGGPIDPGGGMTIGGKSTKAVDDALYAAAQVLRDQSRAWRKIIMLVSDGANGMNNTYRFEDALKALLSADISVYGIGVGSAMKDRNASLLSLYAQATGGDVYYATSNDDLSNLYARATEEARNGYTLAYSPAATNRTRGYHAIQVLVKRPDVTVLARRGYYPTTAPAPPLPR